MTWHQWHHTAPRSRRTKRSSRRASSKASSAHPRHAGSGGPSARTTDAARTKGATKAGKRGFMSRLRGQTERRMARGEGYTYEILTTEASLSHPKKMAILVGGGPAPGINSVIGAATIRGVLEGVEVLGVRDGFEWIMQGNTDHVIPLTIEEVSRIHFRGGSYLGISRANPTLDPRHLENTVVSLLKLDVSQLVTIGGDDTAYSAMKLQEKAAGRIQVVHVPKTIDNDLDLPAYVDTFGFQTARHIGVDIVKNLMVDANTTSRWYFVIAMGRKAGHLALGIGKAAGATLTLIPEEF